MLSGYWLLSDLDGTLISTPHKAHGLYLPISSSPCYPSVRRWLLNGGNVCIVTTADSRVFSQVYLPLRDCLRSSAAQSKEYWEQYDDESTPEAGGAPPSVSSAAHATSSSSSPLAPPTQPPRSHKGGGSKDRRKTSGDGDGPINHKPRNGNSKHRGAAVVTTIDYANDTREEYAGQYDVRAITKNRLRVGGSLLLSLYTGAVIYHCTYDSVRLLPKYASAVHCATAESVWLTRQLSIELPKAPVYEDYGAHKLRNGASSSGPPAPNGNQTLPESAKGVQPPTRLMYCVQGTCISRGVAHMLQARVKSIYVRYIGDVLRGDAATLAALQKLSRRYKRMWRALLVYLDLLYVSHRRVRNRDDDDRRLAEEVSRRQQADRDFALHTRQNSIAQADSSDDYSVLFEAPVAAREAATTPARKAALAEAIEWKLAYVDGCDDLLASLGILRVEYVDYEVSFEELGGNANPARAAVTPTAADHSTPAEAASTAGLPPGVAAVVEHARAVLAKPLPAAELNAHSRNLIVNFSNFMTTLLGPDPKDLSKRVGGRPTDDGVADVAQVIVLGIPIDLYSSYFEADTAQFVRSGVHALPQPNSVVFSKLGVSKSTALRYLLGKSRVADSDDAAAAAARVPGAAKPKNFGQVVRCERAVALGDNPQSTDYELTVFPDVAFVSIEKWAQREARHARIAAAQQRIERGDVPGGDVAAARARLAEAVRRSGPLMDDRLLPNLTYVGGEEEGTHATLDTLMDVLLVPPLGVEGSAEPLPVPVEPEEFTDALTLAFKYAREKMRQKSQAKL